MIKLWVRGKDIVTGFSWILTARSSFLTWCDRYQITPEVKDWVVGDTMSFDENSIEVIDDGVSSKFNESTPAIKKTGWPLTYRVKNNWL